MPDILELPADVLVVRPNKACELLSCSKPTLYQLIHDGRLTAYKEGTATLITTASIRKHIADRLKRAALK